MSTAPFGGWVAKDARRAARQAWRTLRPLAVHLQPRPNRPPPVAATSLAATIGVCTLGMVFAVATRTWWLAAWIAGCATACWAVTAPFRHMLRWRLRAAARAANVTPPPRITWWLVEPAVTGRRLHVRWAVRRRPYGYETTITLPAGMSHQQLDGHRDQLRATLDCRDVLITRDHDRGGHATLAVIERLPWTPYQRIAWPHTNATQLSIWEPVPVALDMRLDRVDWTLVRPGGSVGILTGGIPGSGKSTFLHLIVATGALDPTCTLVILDGKHAELAAWRPAARFYVGFDVPAAIAALKWAVGWMENRLLHLDKVGRRHCEPGDPMLLFVCDEWATYTTTVNRAHADEFNRYAELVVQRGRAAGVVVAFGTQKAAANVIPTSVRDLLSYRAGFRAMTPEASDMVNGRGMAHRGYSAVDIPHDQPGVAWLNPAGELPRLCKSYALTDEQLEALAARATPAAQPDPQPQPGPASNGQRTRGDGDPIPAPN